MLLIKTCQKQVKCKKKKKERERGRHRALAGPGGVGCSVCTESQLRRAQTRPGTQFSLFDFFLIFALFHSCISFPRCFYLGKELNSSPPGAARSCPQPNSLAIRTPPSQSFPGLQSAPMRARGAQGNTRVHRRVSACPWSVTVRAMAVSHPLTCESAHPDCAPGSEFPRTPTLGAGLADTPRSEDRGGLRGAGTREHVAWELACIRTQRKHVC